MRRVSLRRTLWPILLASLFVIGIQPARVLAQEEAQVTIGAQVVTSPEGVVNPVVEFRGRASVEAVIEVRRDGAVIKTITADQAAAFSLGLPDQPTGQHIFEIRATDAASRVHPALTFALRLSTGSTTLVSGIFLGPTISLDQGAKRLGALVTVNGRTVPRSLITVTAAPGARKFTAAANDLGHWTMSLNTASLGVGSHTFVAVAVAPDGGQSKPSRTATLTVSPGGRPAELAASDLNRDGRVDLTDFSILLYFWQDTSPENPRADINQDGRVAIVDFSIMLFQWTD
ncbi:MAG: hypothetical protein HYY50_04510 [Candidatus Kerfeldbacteria bacterium]|nr:hypothetical protein [Candidatus Kerfeldbacteria bacterium]